jgi:hypothetical protein
MNHRVRGFLLAAALLAAPAIANDVSVSKHTAAPPDEIAPALKELLAPGGATAKVGETTVEFWWVKSLEAKGADWSSVAEGTLVGAMRLAAQFRDIRGRVVKPGTYLLRFALQPQNGDHLGVSPYREFLLATPAAEDTTPQPLGHDPAVELAKKTINISHPAVFSLDPPVATAEPLSSAQNDAGHTSVIFQVPTPQGPLTFGLVLVGRIEA